ncbi:hypothetical protein [Caballeronia catudaia]|uniref:hypothetical protein n=1 Tax=Caballeronia catudaia TaxID=1777136 RepID=UPI00117FC6CB|nr:hypothetical protein [Caballeronia catudaia]
MNAPSVARIATHAIDPAAMLWNSLLNQTPPSMAAANTSMTHAKGGHCSFSKWAMPKTPMRN